MKSIVSLLLIILFYSCHQKKSSLVTTENQPFSEVKTLVVENKTYDSQIKYIKKFAKTNKKNEAVAFMIDYSLHSGRNRFFVVDLKKNKILKKALVCHGSCKDDTKNDENAQTFSNVSESLCTSLGMAEMGERAYSRWGKNYKYWIDGLESTNSNMRKRVVVLHAWKHVPDTEIFPRSIVMSWGCPTVSIAFLDELDAILKKNKDILLYSFR